MFISPPRTIFHLPSLSLFLSLIGALISPPSQRADPPPATTQEMSIPPGMDDLDSLQADYEKASKELQTYFELIKKQSPACPNGNVIAKLFEKSAGAQANQRKKIVDALNLSKLELQTEVAKLDGIVAEMKQSQAGAAIVDTSKDIIAKGAKKPLDVIAEEQKKIKLHNKRMQDSVAGAAAALDGPSAKCREARDTYFNKMRPLALDIPKKLGKVEASLGSHKAALDHWADSVGKSRLGRTPASY